MKRSFDLHLLVPAVHLPQEGQEVKPFTGVTNENELLAWFVDQLDDAAIAFAASDEGFETSTDLVTLNHVQLLWAEEEADAPWLATGFAQVELPLHEAVAAEAAAPRYAGTETSDEERLQQLLAQLRNALEPYLTAFRGVPMPLLEWIPGELPGSGHAIFHGVWLADEADLKQLGPWSASDAASGLIFEDADVEARGLREMAAAVAMLGVVFGGSAEAAPGTGGKGATPAAQSADKADRGSFLKRLFGGEEKESAAAPTTANKSTAQNKSAPSAKVAAKPAPVVKLKPQSPPKQNDELLAQAKEGNVRVVVDIDRQRAYLLVDGKIALETPVSTAKKGSWTPRGSFTITQKVRQGKMSTIYHCPLPYWMRLGETPIGMHIGDIPGYPASHGCVRLPAAIAPVMFDHLFKGTTVQIVNSWTPDPGILEPGQMIADR
jgi:lipoprotein-anchoring transpeptidase ErfK/SrfK